MIPFEAFDKKNLFVITDDDYILVIVGFPVWRAFVSAPETDIWIEIIPAIDVSKRIIILPKKKQIFLQKNLFNKESEPRLEPKKQEIDPEVVYNFFASIPSNIIELVSHFPDSHWELIRAVKLIGDDFVSLIKSNPSLAHIIVNMEKLNPSFLYYANIELLQRMIKTKRKEILRLCGFPEAAQMVKIFSKIDPNDLDIKTLIKLKDILMTESKTSERVMHLLSFAKKINKNLLNLVSFFHNELLIISDKIVYQLTNAESYSEKVLLLQKMYKDSKRWKVRIPVIDSVEKLDKMKMRFDEQVKKKRDKVDKLPAPPIDDNEYVTAIKTESGLISWSKRQQNCIRNYAKDVRSGKSYFYRVIVNSEEATLEMKRLKGKYQRSDLLGVKNSEVSEELSAIVKDWLKSNNKILNVH